MTGNGNQPEKAFSSSVIKAGGVEADVEVGTEEQQLSIALVVVSKGTGKKRVPPKKMGSDMGVGR